MAFLLTFSPFFTLLFLLFLLLHTQPLKAQYAVNEDFITKNGTRVKLSLIRRYLQYASDKQLSHMVFQLNAKTNELTSYHRVIEVPKNSSKTRIKEPVVPSVFQTCKPEPFFLRKTPDGHFIYNEQNNLVAAYGDTLDMHSLNSINHPDIFINHFPTLHKLDVADGISHRLKGPQCTDEYNLEFDIRFDKELCARYGYSFRLTYTVLQLFMEESTRVIQEVTCVHISVMNIWGSCFKETSRYQFNWPSLSAKNCTDNSTIDLGCDTISKKIMDKVRKDFPLLAQYQGRSGVRTVPSSEYQDMRLVFSGLQGAGSLAGIAYRAQACSSKHGYSWVYGISRIALYHEIGHMLGANHDAVGIMRPDVRVGEDIFFSNRSRYEMTRFVMADPRSWCLHRKLEMLEGILKADDWSSPIKIPMIDQNETRLKLKAMTVSI